MTSRNESTQFYSGHSLARLVIILLVLCILLDLVALALGYSQIALLQLAAYLISGFFFLIWIYRVHRNLPALGIRRPRFSPGWAVGWFFVPILNLYCPYEVMKELWKESNPDVGISDTALKQYSATTKSYSSKSVLIGLWWGFWIASAIVARASARLSSDGGELITETLLSRAPDALRLIGTVFAILIVKEIDARQEEKHRRLTVDDRLP